MHIFFIEWKFDIRNTATFVVIPRHNHMILKSIVNKIRPLYDYRIARKTEVEASRIINGARAFDKSDIVG